MSSCCTGHMVNVATVMPMAFATAFWLREQLLQYQQRFENFLNQEVLYLLVGGLESRYGTHVL